jgi:hypothetical protein
MTRPFRFLTVLLLCGVTTALAQTPPTTPTTTKTSAQGTDSKEPPQPQNTAPKASSQGTDSQEPAKTGSTAKGSFQDTYTQGAGKKAPMKRDAGM